MGDPIRAALIEIVAMAENADSPSHSMQGRANAWASLGDRAVQLARAALAADREPEPVNPADALHDEYEDAEKLRKESATDPVRAAAEDATQAYFARTRISGPGAGIGVNPLYEALEPAMQTLRAALAADREPEPVQITKRDDLISTLWLYIGRYAETQLTTEQKELLYDILDASPVEPGRKLDRWWVSEPPPEGEKP